jgi:putative sterol carrier protein
VRRRYGLRFCVVADEFPVSNEAQLIEFLSSHTDDEVNALATTTGVDEVLAQVLSSMRDRFQPDQAAGLDAVVRWDVRAGDETHTFHMVVKDGRLTVAMGPPADPPRVMLGLDLPDFLRLIVGQLDGMQAFMSGRLRLSGDMLFATNIDHWFG